MTEADLNKAFERLAVQSSSGAPEHLRVRIQRRIHELKRNYVQWPYAAAIIIALGVLGAMQIQRIHRQTFAKQSHEIIVEELLPTNTLYHEQD